MYLAVQLIVTVHGLFTSSFLTIGSIDILTSTAFYVYPNTSFYDEDEEGDGLDAIDPALELSSPAMSIKCRPSGIWGRITIVGLDTTPLRSQVPIIQLQFNVPAAEAILDRHTAPSRLDVAKLITF
ncbi:hypothetical protein GGR53DRAFT_463746 [Hypoxylon sp. FL1150]|nr:hypothetical protein GGR53DRAFT_463746 [Hypoxylon sp. FL1150]